MPNVVDLPTWLEQHADTVFGYWVYKKVFTPYEQAEKFTDESQFEDSQATTAKITEIVNLGNGDFLIGFRAVDVEYDGEVTEYGMTSYHPLSSIQLAIFDHDNERNKEDDPNP